MEEVSSSVPILECGLNIVHREMDDEEAVQERGRVLQDVGEAVSEEETLLNLVAEDRPTEVLLGAELVSVMDPVAADLPSVVPYGVDEAVPPLKGEADAWVPLEVGDPDFPRACVEVLG